MTRLDLKQLSKKLAMLLTLLTGQRLQTIHKIKRRNIKFNHGKMTIIIDELLKTSRPGHHLAPIVLQNYAPNKRLCVVTYMRGYLERTQKIANSEYLFISTRKPYKQISKERLSNWVKLTMRAAGVDTTVFAPHSTRSAATSCAVHTVPLDQLLKNVGWASAPVFQKYYRKPIARVVPMDQAILKAATEKKKRN